jgi:ABC-2 type transport system ATP-binding protein
MNLLEVSHLKKYYATQKAVDDISFNIKKGSIFGLLGPNGAGKTTLLRMVTGIFFPDEGEIKFEGKKFNPEEDTLRIGYMPEERGLYKKMKIGEQALYLARLKGLSKNDAMEKLRYWFNKFEMQSWWNKKVEDLSKGMGQKLQFVTTVLHQPSLIILDEPFSGLDPVNTNLIKDEIYNLAAQGSTIIFSTHRMEQVEEICDQIMLVNKGRKVLDGSVPEIRQQYKENLFHLSLSTLPLSDNAPVFSVVKQHKQELVVKINEGYTTDDLLRYFIEKNAGVQEFHEVLPTLNDIFIRLVEGTSTARQFQPIN